MNATGPPAGGPGPPGGGHPAGPPPVWGGITPEHLEVARRAVKVRRRRVRGIFLGVAIGLLAVAVCGAAAYSTLWLLNEALSGGLLGILDGPLAAFLVGASVILSVVVGVVVGFRAGRRIAYPGGKRPGTADFARTLGVPAYDPLDTLAAAEEKKPPKRRLRSKRTLVAIFAVLLVAYGIVGAKAVAVRLGSPCSTSGGRPVPAVPWSYQWSPDGSQVAYQAWCDDSGYGGNVRVLVLDLASGAKRLVTRQNNVAWSALRWTADGFRMVMVQAKGLAGGRAGRRQAKLVLLELDGEVSARELPALPQDWGNLSLSANGEVLFVVDAVNRSLLWVQRIPAAGSPAGPPQSISHPGVLLGWIAPSPSGKLAAFAIEDAMTREYQLQLCVVRADDEETTCKGSVHHLDGRDLGFSPDDRRLAYPCGLRTGLTICIDEVDELTATAQTVKLPNHPDYRDISGFEWSPDGRVIAFTTLDWSRYGRGGTDIEVVSDDGRPDVVIDSGSDARWSPDGTRLLFVRDVSEYAASSNFGSAPYGSPVLQYELFIANADGSGGEIQLTSKGI